MELTEEYIAELRRVFGQGRPKLPQIIEMLTIARLERPADISNLILARSFADFMSSKVKDRRFNFKSERISIWPGNLEDGERVLVTTSHLFPQLVWFFHHRQGRGIRLLTPGPLLGAAHFGPGAGRISL